ncbi:putative RING-H2 finger protein ATL21A [Silene latifolia]|uniref:putative RING-H2 finger protein ATL21A n=1 Tax=Silene latifolia TaxID=37657 RepID=UPI003D771961
MSTDKFSIPISFMFLNYLLLISSLPPSEEKQECIESKCSRKNGYLPIRFPFSVANKNQHKSCKYPGFELYCDSFNKTLLTLPNSGNFSVEGIDYSRQEIMLSDPDNCLARKLLTGLDLSLSPFTAQQYIYQNISFYKCSKSNENYTNDKYWDENTINCLSSDPNYAVVWVNSVLYFAESVDQWCELIGTVSAPGASLNKVLNANMMLHWDKPECGDCENNVTRCEFRNNGSDLETTCKVYNPPIARQASKTVQYAIGFSVGLGVPAVIVFALLLRKFVRSRRRSLPENGQDGGSVEMTSHE